MISGHPAFYALASLRRVDVFLLYSQVRRQPSAASLIAAELVCLEPARVAGRISNSSLSRHVPYRFLHSHDFLFVSFDVSQLKSTKMTLSPLKNILLMNRSLLTPFFPSLPFSVHISLTFSNIILQCRSKALTRARSFLLLRHEMRTCVWVRVAVMRIERGPVESSCASRRETSYSLVMIN